MLVFDFSAVTGVPSVFNNPTVMLLASLLLLRPHGVYRHFDNDVPPFCSRCFSPSLTSPLISIPAVAGIPAAFSIYAVVGVSAVAKVAVVEGVFAVIF